MAQYVPPASPTVYVTRCQLAGTAPITTLNLGAGQTGFFSPFGGTETASTVETRHQTPAPKSGVIVRISSRAAAGAAGDLSITFRIAAAVVGPTLTHAAGVAMNRQTALVGLRITADDLANFRCVNGDGVNACCIEMVSVEIKWDD